MSLVLVQAFAEPVAGWFDGGPRRVFTWAIESRHVGKDARGEYVRVGSWDANSWFYVAKGGTERQTLANARRRLTYLAKRAGRPCTYRYEDEREV